MSNEFVPLFLIDENLPAIFSSIEEQLSIKLDTSVIQSVFDDYESGAVLPISYTFFRRPNFLWFNWVISRAT